MQQSTLGMEHIETIHKPGRIAPLRRGAAVLTAVVACGATLSACEGANTKASVPAKIGECTGSLKVRVRDHTTLEDLIIRHTHMTDGLYSPGNGVDNVHEIAVSRSKAGKLTKPIGNVTVRNYTWFNSALQPKKGSTVYLPAECRDKGNSKKV